ncbi:hypothetical protein B0H15DRAFT_947485 [Mycena belliarum]|uniref:Ribonuclease H1 N-terminal domain-containing protein n=1 Tax=Mycena belliarum TaxID=1033014 RepID=A0AAD6U8D8_9AGAR|nr:hypothetical protein B0H15DRAFT_947485 [Mycena belliae]
MPPSSIDDLVVSTGALSLEFYCCELCCKPRFFVLPGDPPLQVLSSSAKRKFYVVSRGASGSEGIYSHWSIAGPQVTGVSTAIHKSCRTVDEGLEIWAAHCHKFHSHGDTLNIPNTVGVQQVSIAPPAYSPLTPAPPPLPASPVQAPRRFYRIPGSPRVLVDRQGKCRASLADVEDDGNDSSTTAFSPSKLYRVFGSRRVQTNRGEAIAELVATHAGGLLVGSLEDVENEDT